LAYKYDKTEASLVFAMRSGAYDTESLIEFVEQFHAHFPGQPFRQASEEQAPDRVDATESGSDDRSPD
jgi:hypothetical protein